MPSIRILPDRVANQIAAGEVIERPVAVVKELVENSIDAGANRIEVEFRNGGKSYIRVEDDGPGMSPDEALNALERHATSKIRVAGDLDEVRTFGFRGEALPSIASVSKFTLRTRAEGWSHGTEIVVNGGKLVDRRDCGMPVGTVIEVARLFNSVPARRKFLKTEATESAHITYTARLFAVAHPRVGFRVCERERTIFQSPSCEDLRDRVAEIWGARLAADLMPVWAEDPALGLRLSGLTAKPGVSRSTRRELVTLVNRRPVDSRTLGFAVLDAYHGYLPKGRYPPAFLFLEIEPAAVDVNVHPAKREVRFRDEARVRRFVLNAVAEALQGARRPDVSPSEARGGAVPETTRPAAPVGLAERMMEASRRARVDNPLAPPGPPSERPAGGGEASGAAVEASEQEPPAGAPRLRGWRLLARLGRQYALFQTPEGLITLHLGHAGQRVLYERILRDWAVEATPSQRLLIPLPVEFEPLAAEALREQAGALRERGFGIEEFGRNYFRIESVPVWLPPEETESFVRDLADLMRQRGGFRRGADQGWEAVAQLAARRARGRDDPMPDDALLDLARELMACGNPHTTPFGQPTYVNTAWAELRRRFGED